jgi:hypothetical protein
VSATNRGAIRNANDFYPTPAPAIDALLSVLDLSRGPSFLEPCKGDGAICDRIPVYPKYACEITEGRDYFKYKPHGPFDLIITNPPFSQALEFLQKSLAEADCVIYLLRLNFLGSRQRRQFWRDNPPTHLLALAERPVFAWTCRPAKGEKRGCGAAYLPGSTNVCTCGRRVGPSTDATDYGWFCWDKRGFVKRPPGVHVL